MEAKVSPDAKDLTLMDKRVLHDFYLSFRVSQGDPELQYLALIYAGKSYDTMEIGDIDEMNNRVYGEVLKLSPLKKEHKQEFLNKNNELERLDFDAGQNSKNGFRNQWDFFLAVLNRVHLQKDRPLDTVVSVNQMKVLELYETTENQLNAEILINIITRDTVYQNRERPLRMHGSDPHESLLRTYMVEGKRTGSESFDLMYKKMGEIFKKLGFEYIADGKHQKPDVFEKGYKELGLDPHLAIRLSEKYMAFLVDWNKAHPGVEFLKKGQ